MKSPMKKPMAPAKSMRPKAKPADMASMQAMQRGENAAKREGEDYKSLALKKMKTGGMAKKPEMKARGAGAATKGTMFNR